MSTPSSPISLSIGDQNLTAPQMKSQLSVAPSLSALHIQSP
ncbi:hypothetical protein LXL04_007666 [Taraxacum kok-saghyz]